MTESTIRCMIVDDEPLAVKLLETYVARTPFLELAGTAYSAEEALASIASCAPSLVFLDINMPGLSGMQLARLLPEGVKVIFTTAYSDHAAEGFRVRAVDYLLKPISYEDFLEGATRVLPSATFAAPKDSGLKPAFILVKSEYKLLRIPVESIQFIEGLKDYVKIYVEGEQRSILTLMSMKSLEESLPAQFIRVHRSFIINMDKVRVIERNAIIMADRSIPVSESYRKRFFSELGLSD